jgi:PAS domain S-box-containing protein
MNPGNPGAGLPAHADAEHYGLPQNFFAALRRDPSLLLAMMDALPFDLYIKDRASRFVLINQNLLKKCGFATREEIVGKTDFDRMDHAQAQPFFDAEQQILQTGEGFFNRLEKRTREDKQVVYLISSKIPLRDAKGNIVGLLGTNHDVTDQIELQRLLRQREEYYAMAVETARLGILDWDWKLRQLRVDSEFIQLMNLHGQEPPLTLREWMAQVQSQDRPRLRMALREALRHHEPELEIEFRVGPTDEQVYWLVARMRIFYSANRKPLRVLVTLMDITERKQEEAARLQLEAGMQQAQKLESLGVLAGGIAHDFNNLLMGVVGTASLAVMELPPEHPVQDYLQQIEQAGQRMADLTRQLLAYAGCAQYQIRQLDLNALVRELTQLVRVSVSRKAHLNYELSPEPVWVQADVTQMHQVLLNLLTNASEALPEGHGSITVRTARVSLPEETPAVAAGHELAPGEYVLLEVSDTGCGMDEATQARIFEPFFTTKFTGRGLGLAALQGIVRAHHGWVGITSAPGMGTTFTILYPRLETLGEEQPPADTRDAAPWRAQGKVLVIDDEVLVRDVVRTTLEQAGLQVIAAKDGTEGFLLYHKHRCDIDLVLLDLTMPGASGNEVLGAIYGVNAQARVLLMSGYSDQETVVRFGDRPHCGLLTKPFKSDQLLECVRAALRHTGPGRLR